MTQEQIDKAFEGRWRIYGNYGKMNQNLATMSFDEFFDSIKEMCRNFFTAGAILAHGAVDTVAYELPHVEVLPQKLLEQEFNVWWNLYQKKRGREKCMKKWAKLSAKDRQACIQATPAYVQSTPDVTYRKDPYTYLNNKSWNDTIYFRNNTDLQRQQRLAASAELVARYAAEGNSPQSEVPEAD